MPTSSSATVQCARCHDHKFDPISQEEYYALQAVFAGVDRANRVVRHRPEVKRRRELLWPARRELGEPSPIRARALLDARIAARRSPPGRRGCSEPRPVDGPRRRTSHRPPNGATLTKQADGSRPVRRAAAGTRHLHGHRAAAAGAGHGVRLEVLTDDSLPQRGPGRQDNGNLHLSEIRGLRVGDANGAGCPIATTTADFDQEDWGVAQAIDGKPETAWGIYPQVGKPHEAVFELAKPLTADDAARLTVVLEQLHGGGHLIGRLRLSVTDADPPVGVDVLPADDRAILPIAGGRADARSSGWRLRCIIHRGQGDARAGRRCRRRRWSTPRPATSSRTAVTSRRRGRGRFMC